MAKKENEKAGTEVVEKADLTPEILGEIFDSKDRMDGIELRLQQIGIIHRGRCLKCLMAPRASLSKGLFLIFAM